ncbi:unnamed protein product [Mytilus edulis]|uniref:Uncharacterized protein n=1 Tax=Mytilus edulis TaxID=6550 RepID=A0A8S3TFK2_MYTED|nr:unnamed protein product [Mytilus edulis]
MNKPIIQHGILILLLQMDCVQCKVLSPNLAYQNYKQSKIINAAAFSWSQSNDISVSHRLPTKEGHKQIIARFTHTKKRAEFLKATKNIRNIPDLHGVGISQDLTKARSRVAFLAREAVRKGKLKSSSVWDGKIFLTAINDDKRIVSTESELNDFINGKPDPRRSDIENNVADMPIARSPGTPHFQPNNMMFPPQMMQYQSGAQAMYPHIYFVIVNGNVNSTGDNCINILRLKMMNVEEMTTVTRSIIVNVKGDICNGLHYEVDYICFPIWTQSFAHNLDMKYQHTRSYKCESVWEHLLSIHL